MNSSRVEIGHICMNWEAEEGRIQESMCTYTISLGVLSEKSAPCCAGLIRVCACEIITCCAQQFSGSAGDTWRLVQYMRNLFRMVTGSLEKRDGNKIN